MHTNLAPVRDQQVSTLQARSQAFQVLLHRLRTGGSPIQEQRKKHGSKPRGSEYAMRRSSLRRKPTQKLRRRKARLLRKQRRKGRGASKNLLLSRKEESKRIPHQSQIRKSILLSLQAMMPREAPVNREEQRTRSNWLPSKTRIQKQQARQLERDPKSKKFRLEKAYLDRMVWILDSRFLYDMNCLFVSGKKKVEKT